MDEVSYDIGSEFCTGQEGDLQHRYIHAKEMRGGIGKGRVSS